MADALFTLVSGTKLYLSNAATSQRPFVFLANAFTGPTGTLGDIWLADPSGCFVCLSAPVTPSNWAQIEKALRSWLAFNSTNETNERILWVTLGPDDITPLTVIPLCINSPSAPSTLSQSVTFDFTGYVVFMPEGATIAPSPSGDTLLVSGSSVFSRDGFHPVSYPMVRNIINITVNGDNSGALQFAIDLNNDGSDGSHCDFEKLGVGIRYCWPSGKVGVDFYHSPTFTQPAGTTTIWGNYFPLDSNLNPQSRFSFIADGRSPGTASNGLESSFVTPEGRNITMTPLSGITKSGGLALGRQPLFAANDSNTPYIHYLTPDGDFSIETVGTVTALDQFRVVCGLGVMEHISGAAKVVTFSPGNAFLPTAGLPLNNESTTAWITIGGVTNEVTYYAQPEAAPFYGEGTFPGIVDGYIASLDLPAAILSAGNSALPMIGYSGIGTAVGIPVFVEQTLLAPTRASIVGNSNFHTKDKSAAPALSPFGLTPQGLMVGLAGQPGSIPTWPWMGIGNTTPNASIPDLVFKNVSATFQKAMQNASPFVVLANSALVLNNATADNMVVKIDDWTFQMGPATWGKTTAAGGGKGKPPGIMIIKLDRTTSIQQWINQLDKSSWPEAAIMVGLTINDTTDILRDSVKTAQSRLEASADQTTSPYFHFLNVVLIEPTWTGTLMLNASILPTTIPSDFQAIEAGIDLNLFYAHHIGLETGLVAVTNQTLNIQQGRAFGAIDYEDTADLVLDSTNAADFQFKALQLVLGFERSHLTTFIGKVELFVNRLFSATTRKFPTVTGNNIVLNGVKISEVGNDGKIRNGYRFGTGEKSNYQLAGSALSNVVVDETSLSLNQALCINNQLVTDFTLAGGLKFQAVPGFDMFSFGPDMPPANNKTKPAFLSEVPETKMVKTPFGMAKMIGHISHKDNGAKSDNPRQRLTSDPVDNGSALLFSNLIVRMTYTPGQNTTFEVLNSDSAFNIAGSTPRKSALAARFPAKPIRFIKGDGTVQTPKDLGYLSVSCDVQQALLNKAWYGIEYEMELGTLGALAKDVGITISILAAWGVDQTTANPPVFFGITMEAMGMSGFEFSLQGILKIGFRTLQFETYTATDGLVGYLMRLRDFGLSILGKSFPPGHISVLIAGAPEPVNGAPSKLGWFAGYEEENYQPVSRSIIRKKFATPGLAQLSSNKIATDAL